LKRKKNSQPNVGKKLQHAIIAGFLEFEGRTDKNKNTAIFILTGFVIFFQKHCRFLETMLIMHFYR